MLREQDLAMGLEYEKYYSQADRKSMDDSDFAGPHMSFPIKSQQDVNNAAKLVGHAADPAAVKAAIIRIAKRKGFTLPDSWQDDTAKTKEAAPALSSIKARNKIATIKTAWLEDNAVSLNQRKYPPEAVDRLIRSAQLALSNENALPLTCYLSHEDADKDATSKLAGKITKVWREGSTAYASIDIPDTQAGREVAILIKGGYIKSQSLRASGAEMRMDQESAFPLVSGNNLQLEGIDFTTTPGLAQVARITDIQLVEAQIADSQKYTSRIIEVFNSHPTIEEDGSMQMATIKEEGIDPLVSGTSVGMTTDNPKDDYGKRMYPAPSVQDAGNADIDQQIHDHISTGMGLECSPLVNHESSKQRKQRLQEAGAKFSAFTKGHLMNAHDKCAGKNGVSCAGPGSSDGMQDGDDDDGAQSQEKKNMNAEQAAKILKEAGYTVAAPKTELQLLQEELAAIKAALSEQRTAQPPMPLQQQAQRKSLVETPVTEKKPYYRPGDYLREKIQSLDFEKLVDRSSPLPADIDPERLLKELYGVAYKMSPDEYNRYKKID